MMRLPHIICCCLLLLSGVLRAQGPGDWWFFGQMAGIHFTNTGPVADTSTTMIAIEGCASIADFDGNLLFYSNGKEVWHKNHGPPMPNGDSLLGSESSSQAAIIVPRPGFEHRYFIFTPSPIGGDGLRYTEIDLNLNGGLGDVIVPQKNVFLRDSTSEKIAAILHENGSQFWVLTHDQLGNRFLAYEVTADGVNHNPVISEIGTPFNPLDAVGYMRFSPDGNRLAMSRHIATSVDLFDFDKSTGQVTNLIVELTLFATPYGVEFSPNGKLLYTADLAGNINQWDVSFPNPIDILNSMNIVGNVNVQNKIISLQNGPDKKMYVSENEANFIGGITNPNVYGLGCNYIQSYVSLSTRSCWWSLPTIPQYAFDAQFKVEHVCLGDTTLFTPDTVNVTAVSWNFGDPGSGVNDTSTALFPTHVYPDTGEYFVQLIVTSDTAMDTVTQYVVIHPLPELDLGNDTTICFGDSLVLDANFHVSTYLWSDGSMYDTLLVEEGGEHWVELSHVCGILSDTVMVEVDTSLKFTLGPDTTICDSQSFVLDPKLLPGHGTTFLWQDGSTDSIFTVNVGGEISLTASGNCGSRSDSILVTINPAPNAELPNDTVICLDIPVVLSHTNLDSTTYTWFDSTSQPTKSIAASGTYWLHAQNECGTSIDSFTVIFKDPILLELGNDTTICDSISLVLDASVPNASYLWQDGSTDSTYTVSTSGLYEVEVRVEECLVRDSLLVESNFVACIDSIDCLVFVPNVFTPNGDGSNDLLLVSTTCEIENFKLGIYNRWGQRIYEADHENIGWDGTINGIQAPEGVYYWIIDFQDDVVVDVDRKGKTGSISLYR